MDGRNPGKRKHYIYIYIYIVIHKRIPPPPRKHPLTTSGQPRRILSAVKPAHPHLDGRYLSGMDTQLRAIEEHPGLEDSRTSPDILNQTPERAWTKTPSRSKLLTIIRLLKKSTYLLILVFLLMGILLTMKLLGYEDFVVEVGLFGLFFIFWNNSELYDNKHKYKKHFIH